MAFMIRPSHYREIASTFFSFSGAMNLHGSVLYSPGSLK